MTTGSNSNSTSSYQAGSSTATEITGRAAVTIIILLFMVVVFVFFLHLYTKRFWWRGGDNIRVLSTGQAAERAAGMHNGLDQSILKSLPVLVFSSDLEEFKEGLECSVCLSEVVDGEETRLLPKCSHGFHVSCIDMWFQSHSTCPLCRDPVSSPLKPSGSEAQAIDVMNSTTFLQVPESSSESSDIPYSNEGLPAQSLVVDGGPSHTVIDIPMETKPETSPPEDRYGGDEETKAPPVLTRMQTFKRLLSRENRVAACSASSADVESHVS